MINREGGLREREREREYRRLHAGVNRQTESYMSPFAGFTTRSFSAVRSEGLSESQRGGRGNVAERW